MSVHKIGNFPIHFASFCVRILAILWEKPTCLICDVPTAIHGYSSYRDQPSQVVDASLSLSHRQVLLRGRVLVKFRTETWCNRLGHFGFPKHWNSEPMWTLKMQFQFIGINDDERYPTFRQTLHCVFWPACYTEFGWNRTISSLCESLTLKIITQPCLKSERTCYAFPSFSNIVHMFGLFKSKFTMIHINHHHGFCETTFRSIFLDISGWDSLVVWLNHRVWSRGRSLSTFVQVCRETTNYILISVPWRRSRSHVMKVWLRYTTAVAVGMFFMVNLNNLFMGTVEFLGELVLRWSCVRNPIP